MSQIQHGNIYQLLTPRGTSCREHMGSLTNHSTTTIQISAKTFLLIVESMPSTVRVTTCFFFLKRDLATHKQTS